MTRPSYALVRASAGTGKTFHLVETYVREVVERGARPAQVVAITFTRKAAAELRGRIRKRLREGGVEPAVLGELGRAPVGNFHGFAQHLLNGAAYPHGLDEGTAVLGEAGDDRLLFFEACIEAWYGGSVEVGAALAAAALALNVDRLPHALWGAVALAREDGAALDFAALVASYDADAVLASHAARAAGITARLRAAQPTLTGKGREPLDWFISHVPGADLAPLLWAAAWEEACKGLTRRGHLGELIDKDTMAFMREEAAAQILAEVAAARLRPHLVTLADAAWMRYAARKREERAVDFGDLVERAVALLETDHEQHRRLRERVRVVLVDEAQDTNRLQRHFVRLIAGLEGPARDVAPPATLHVVGDRKQAIYTFRGADPESFATFAEDVRTAGGSEEVLTTSFRSAPELVAGINLLGGELFGATYEPLEAVDATRHAAGTPLGRVAMTFVQVAGDGAEDAARAEARAVAQAVLGHIAAGGVAGQCAILLRAQSRAALYAEALARVGIPALLGGGSGFYAQAVVNDVAALLSWLCDGGERLAAAIALRSPLAGVSDNALVVLLAGDGDARPALERLRSGALEEAVWSVADDFAALSRLARALPQLIAATRVMGAGSFLRYCDELLDIGASYLGLAGGEQHLAQFERLCELGDEHESRALGSVAHFARQIARRIADAHQEPVNMPVAAPGAAVVMSSVHAAKGLEYPVVLLCDLGRRPPAETRALLYERQAGILVKPSVDGEPLVPSAWSTAMARAADVAAAEVRRLLYVAVTRAQREVIFFGDATAKPRVGTWLELLAPWLPKATAAAVLRQVVPADLAPRSAPPPTARLAADAGSGAPPLRALAGLGESRSAPPGTRLALPVTQLETYLQCLRRGAFVHQLGLRELGREEETKLHAAADPPLDALARGRLAHAVLAALERRAEQASDRAFVRDEIAALGYDLADSRLAGTVVNLERFLASPAGRALAALPVEQRRHELPFVLAVDAAPFGAAVHGQMDVLTWEAGRPVVVDFKNAKRSATSLDAYRLQLEAYATAAAALCELGDAAVCTRLVFLAEASEPLDFEVTAAMRTSFLARTADVVRALLAARPAGELWAGEPVSRCRELRCGFVSRCHGALA